MIAISFVVIAGDLEMFAFASITEFLIRGGYLRFASGVGADGLPEDEHLRLKAGGTAPRLTVSTPAIENAGKQSMVQAPRNCLEVLAHFSQQMDGNQSQRRIKSTQDFCDPIDPAAVPPSGSATRD